MNNLLVYTVLFSCMLGLAACGSDGNDSSNHIPKEKEPNVVDKKTISGTAAAGAPIIGQVTVKDSQGKIEVTDIRADGSYTVDVSRLKAPFVFQAKGRVGGRDVALVSAATVDDLGKTINITPFTDLIVANIAGQAAVKYFDNPQFDKLTTSELNIAKNMLTQRLLPILKDLGVDDSFDLLRSIFKADHTGFDAVMDVVRVSVDEVNNKALIEDIINKTQIEDDLTTKTDNSIILAPSVPLVNAASNLEAIDSQLKAFSGLFKSKLPTVQATKAFFVSDGSFLQGGLSLDDFIESELLDSTNVGLILSSPVIVEKINDNELGVLLQLSDSNGGSESDYFVFKKEDNVWKIKGNQRSISVDVSSVNVLIPKGSYGYDESDSYSRKLEFYPDYVPNEVKYIQISGAGLTNSIYMTRQTNNWVGWGYLNSQNKNDGTTWLNECKEQPQYSVCVDFGKVGMNAKYTIQPLDENKKPILTSFKLTLERPPVSKDDAKNNSAKYFARVLSITPTNYTHINTGTNVGIKLGIPKNSGVYFSELTYGENSKTIKSDTIDANGLVNLTWEGTTPKSRPFINVWLSGTYNRNFVTLVEH